jgi:NTE family protein
MMDFIEQSNFLKLVKFGLPSGGLSRLTFINERLAAVIPENDFATLQKPLFVAMTNLNSGQLEVRSSGKLFEVITASCCIPLVFQPVEIDGHLYVDGGLLSNLPVEPLLTEADFILGVNVIPQMVLENKALNGVIDIANRCFDLSILANSRPQVSLCDYLVRMEGIGEFGVFQFNRYQEIYELGYAEAVRQMPEILATLKAQEEVVASSSL